MIRRPPAGTSKVAITRRQNLCAQDEHTLDPNHLFLSTNCNQRQRL